MRFGPRVIPEIGSDKAIIVQRGKCADVSGLESAIQLDALIERLNQLAKKCREYAGTALDPMIAQVLYEMAGKIENAMPMLNAENRRLGQVYWSWRP